jgi:hypothetical protein
MAVAFKTEAAAAKAEATGKAAKAEKSGKAAPPAAAG